MKKNIPVIGVLILLSLLTIRELSLLPNAKTHILFLDVGQGDSTFIVSPSGKHILIDGGTNFSPLEELGKRMSFFDRTIELLVLTHPNFDHLAVFPEIFKRYSVKHVLLTGVVSNLPHYQAVLNHILTKNIPVIFPTSDTAINMGDGLVFDVMWPAENLVGKHVKELNDTSIVLKMKTGTTSILLPGDIEEWAEQAILQTGRDIHADILKAPHHGSKSSSSTGFLLAVSSKTAVISAGGNNPFGHPHADVVARYSKMGMDIRRTDKEGTIVFSFPP
jgi:competence protein ComEC